MDQMMGSCVYHIILGIIIYLLFNKRRWVYAAVCVAVAEEACGTITGGTFVAINMLFTFTGAAAACFSATLANSLKIKYLGGS